MNDAHRDAFREEAEELLVTLEEALLELEQAPDDKELIGKVFRAMHTIKGSGAMFGFDDIAEFTHEIETVYDKVRSGRIKVSKDLISLTLEARDIIKSMLDESSGEALPGQAIEKTVSAFRRLVPAEEEGTGTPPAGPSSPVGASPSLQKKDTRATYRIRFAPSPDIFAAGVDPILLLNELSDMGEATVTAITEDVPCLDAIDAEKCYTRWDIVLTTDRGEDAIRDVFIFVEDRSEISIKTLEDDDYKIGEILVERGDITPDDLKSVLADKKYTGEILVEKGATTQGLVDSALAEQQHLRKQSKEDAISSIRVPAEKLDALVNLVGELVTVQARLAQAASAIGGSDITAVSEEVERLTAELRETTMNIRMVPIGAIFGRFKRMIRDLSGELGKEAEMTTEGAETELDKTVIEKLNDPLVHLIRNCVDHGIEPPEARLAAGKARSGTIRLAAIHSGNHVIISIEDDGKGLDRDAILAKAVVSGLTTSTDLADRDVFAFIFEPGFSTAEKVTNVSGRGVGMDVVKKAIDALGGTIGLASEKGKGTKVIVTLPLTLAIVDGLLVSIAEDRFVLPLSIVEECVELTREDEMTARGGDIANIRGKIVPYVKLRREFGITGESPAIQQIVVTTIGGERVGFVVDSVLGEHQTVIKNLGRVYRHADAVSGATILGNGNVALVLDAPRLLKNAEMRQARQHAVA